MVVRNRPRQQCWQDAAGWPLGEIGLLRNADSSLQQDGYARGGETQHFPTLKWILALLICSIAVALAFIYLDVPIARRVNGLFGLTASLGKGLASGILLGIEAAVVLALVAIRIVRGRLSSTGEATGLACLTSIAAYAVSDSTLKLLFGVPNPTAVLQGARHAFHLLGGNSGNGFPSGHMVLAGAFAGVFIRLHRGSIVLFTALLLIAAALLIVGDWHFVSDVIAGTFLGVSAGLLAGELWLAHSK